MLKYRTDSVIASFRLGGEKIELKLSEMTKSADSYSKRVGDILVILNFEQIAEHFYRWVVWLTNKGNEKTAKCGY